MLINLSPTVGQYLPFYSVVIKLSFVSTILNRRLHISSFKCKVTFTTINAKAAPLLIYDWWSASFCLRICKAESDWHRNLLAQWWQTRVPWLEESLRFYDFTMYKLNAHQRFHLATELFVAELPQPLLAVQELQIIHNSIIDCFYLLCESDTLICNSLLEDHYHQLFWLLLAVQTLLFILHEWQTLTEVIFLCVAYTASMTVSLSPSLSVCFLLFISPSVPFHSVSLCLSPLFVCACLSLSFFLPLSLSVPIPPLSPSLSFSFSLSLSLSLLTFLPLPLS